MRKYTTEHTVYTFDELDETARQKAIESQRQFEYEFGLEWLSEYMQDQLTSLLAKHEIESDSAQVRYSLGYCRGDGASFVGDIVWRGTWRGSVVTNSYGTHYSHYNSVCLSDDGLESVNTGKPAPQATVDKLAGIIQDIGRELERIGYDAIEDATSEERITENIRDNDYEFYADGTQA